MEIKQTIKTPTDEQKERLFQKILDNASQSGYYLNPDKEYNLFLMSGLLTNESRYGYQSCPCRLSSGSLKNDQDIVCPCDYRDADLSEFGMCYCALYVSKAIAEGKAQTKSIPERREAVVLLDKKSDDEINKQGNSVSLSENDKNKSSDEKNINIDIKGSNGVSNSLSSENTTKSTHTESIFANAPYPVWRCKVCGYLCAREEPPEICPICKAAKERFERFF